MTVIFDVISPVDETIVETVPGGIDVTFHEPLGVVGVIVPWNFPMPLAAWGFASRSTPIRRCATGRLSGVQAVGAGPGTRPGRG